MDAIRIRISIVGQDPTKPTALTLVPTKMTGQSPTGHNVLSCGHGLLV